MKRFFLFIFLLSVLAQASAAADGEPLRGAAELSARADALYAAGQADSAIVVARLAVAEARRAADRAAELGALASLGVYQRSSGHPDEALRTYEAALRLAVGADLSDSAMAENVATLYVNLATLYVDEQQKEQALAYARRVAAMRPRLRSADFLTQTDPVLGSVFLVCGRNAEAEPFLRRAVASARAAGAADQELQALCYYAVVLWRQGKTAELRAAQRRAAGLAARTSDFMTLVNYYQTSALIFMQQQEWGRTAEVLRRLLDLPAIDAYPYVVYDAYNNLHRCYAARGDWRQAYATLEQATTLRDSIFAAEKSTAMEDMAVKYETREKEWQLKESEALRAAEARRFRRRLAAAGGVAVVLLLFGAVVYLRGRVRTERERRRAEELAREYAELERTAEQRATRRYLDGLESERERLAGELHDGVQGDLLAVEMGLRDALPAGSPWTDRLRSARENVRDIAHGLLPPVFREATLDDVLWDYLGQLDGRGGVAVTYRCVCPDAPWTELPRTVALGVYRIVQEAVTNCLKHAGAHSVDVTLDWAAPAALHLTVADDGHGMEGRQRAASAGLAGMRRRAAAMGGALDCTTGPEGTRLELRVDDFRSVRA